MNRGISRAAALTKISERLTPLHQLVGKAILFETKLALVSGQADAVVINAQVIAQMRNRGDSEAEMLKFKADGYSYSPSRNTTMSPIFTDEGSTTVNEDDDFEEFGGSTELVAVATATGDGHLGPVQGRAEAIQPTIR